MTSDVMNIIIPVFSPLETLFWCSPSFFLSLIVSLHHILDLIANIIIMALILLIVCFLLIIDADLDTDAHRTIDVMIGQGLIDTM